MCLFRHCSPRSSCQRVTTDISCHTRCQFRLTLALASQIPVRLVAESCVWQSWPLPAGTGCSTTTLLSLYIIRSRLALSPQFQRGESGLIGSVQTQRVYRWARSSFFPTTLTFTWSYYQTHPSWCALEAATAVRSPKRSVADSRKRQVRA